GKNSLNAVSGLLQANNDGNGLVTITGSYGAVVSTRVVTISGQGITATSMTVNGANITVLNGTSQMTALFGPVGANVGTNVTWSSNPIGRINGTGLVSANGLNEIITITGTAGSLSAMKVITISGQIIPVSSISISGVNIINIANGFQSLSATVLPSNATNPTFTWSVITVVGGGKANINNSGIVSATRNGDGIITIVGSAQDGSGVKGYFPMTISGQDNDLISLTIFGQGGNAISVNGGSKLMQTAPFPTNSNGAVIWSILTATGQGRATIDNTGLVTTLIDGNGTVTVVGASIENASISSFAILTITGQTVSVIQITLTSSGVNTISTNGGVANLSVIYSPINTTQTNVSYSSSPSGFVNIDPTGQVTAVDNGVVTITAVSNINPLLTSSLVFTISGQLVKQVTLSGIGGSNDLNTLAGTLQMVATTAPVNAIPESAIWTILGQKPTNAAYNGNDLVTINSITGLVTSRNFSNGLVTISGYLPNSSITSIVVISVSNQREPVLLVNGGPSKSITLTGGNVQLSALPRLPSIATDKSLTYSVISGTGIATVDATGKVFATDAGNGFATIRVASNSDPTIFDDVLVIIFGQTSSFTVEISDGNSNVQPVLGNGVDLLSLYPIFTPIDHPEIPFIRNTLVTFSAEPSGIVDISTASGSAVMSATGIGLSTVTGVYINNPSITYSFVVTVTSLPNSISDNSKNNFKFELSPVPATDVLNLNTKQDLGSAIVKIFNSEGRLVAEYSTNSTIGYEMNITQLARGYYTLVVNSKQGVISKSFIKQ
ncbi:MAG: T9SS C-terminal target domain-containing protein, partial [Bacteroidetes bacterium]